jgi:hypothetical protein
MMTMAAGSARYGWSKADDRVNDARVFGRKCSKQNFAG